MKLSRMEQAMEMADCFLQHCDSLQVAACKHIGRSNEAVLIKNWDPKLLGWFKYENSNNFANIWIRPSPEQLHPWLLIDDVPLHLAIKISRKYQCIVVETSQLNCQIRLLANECLTKEQRKIVQVELVKLLGANADVGSTAGCKWGRLPGFRNRKPDRDAWTNLISIPNTTLPKFDTAIYVNHFSSTVSGGMCLTTIPSRTSKHSSIIIRKDNRIDLSGKDFGYLFGRLKFFKETGRDYLTEAKTLKSDLILSTHKRNPEQYAELTMNAVLNLL